MGIAMMTLAELFHPLHEMASRLIPSRRARSGAMRYVAVRPGCSVRSAAAAGTNRPPTAGLPLRVVRVVDTQNPRSAQGRVVISGRMDDVCAELDRLVALEGRPSGRVEAPLH
ncbi:MAG: hypothetical protein EOO22_05520 [Comamonadaceae bacterium]|nr:MAG: hypothetical protein EOO22_05520 [Comamonadaceae bacterium]